MKPVHLLTIIFLFSLTLIGCTTAIIHDLSGVQYIKEGFNRTALNDGGLALLPIVSGYGQESYRRPFGDSLNFYLHSLRPQLQFITWQEATSKLNDEMLADKYQAAISTYRSTSIIDKSFVSQMGSALGVRYFLYVNLEEFILIEETGVLTAFAQVWDSRIGDVVWEGIGRAKAINIEFNRIPNSYVKYSGVAAKGLVLKLP